MDGDHLTIGYFDNLDNEFLNKYKKKLKKNHEYIFLLID
jgi:hypothetical protein